MKHSYLLAGIKLSQFLKLVNRNGLSLHPKYILRFLFLLQGGIWSSLLSIIEDRKYGKQIKDLRLPDDPIFIIGHWRTGSTFLHQLLNLDERLAAPSVFQISVPDNFLISRKYYKPIMTRMLDAVRPMDQVKLGFDEPQEDEYALVKMGINSPLEKLIFPINNEFFLSGVSSLIPDEPHLTIWINFFQLFFKKLTFQTGKKIVFKNPFHSLRIDLLKEIFPKAYFIYIYRNPYVVIPSTQRMWSIVGKQNCLRKYQAEPSIAEVTATYKTFTESIKRSLGELPEKRYNEIQFEKFEQDPLQTINSLYKHMGMNISRDLEQTINNFLHANKDYKKNRYALSAEEVNLIGKELSDDLEKTGYKNPY